MVAQYNPQQWWAMYAPRGQTPWEQAFARYQQMGGAPTQQTTPSVQPPASTIAGALGGAQAGGSFAGGLPTYNQDAQTHFAPPATGQPQAGDPWGVYKANTRPATPLTDGPNGASHRPSVGGVPGQIAAGLGNPRGYKTGNWNLGQNQFQYAIPQGFQANTNLYQMGYDPNADTNRIAFAGGNGQQTNFDRVYGWMNELARVNGIGDISQAPPEFQQWAMGAAVGRLRTDYQQSGANWAQSGFTGYDKYLNQGGGGTPLGNSQQPRPQPQGEFGGGMRFDGDPSTLPQLPPVTGTFNSPPYGQGGYNPNGATRNDPNGGGVVDRMYDAPASGQTAAEPVGRPLRVNPDGTVSHGGEPMAMDTGGGGAPRSGGGSTVTGTAQTSGGAGGALPASLRLGQFQFGDLDRVIAAARQSPALAAQVLRMANGQTGRTTSALGQYMDNYYGRALQAALAQAGNVGGGGGSGNPLNDILQGFFGAQQSGSIVPYASGLAQRALGADYSGMDDADVQAALAGATALQSLGLGDVAGSRLNTRLDDLLYQLRGDTLSGPQYDQGGRLGQLLNNSPYKRAMQMFAQSR